ncbi:probable cytochrome P450 6a14 [Solenopsis invicta]|uniref:probable cytochrome P450 6a14 n=1 Tax=Solenopsis invicta TaxID=13686 RepID=UPI000595DC38|nr:probable cytochrome P450 6a14 [Solenopsis invicta]XP_039305737.1 probable cytochrome P450 6a14 [Solenopsis invicta]
METFQILCNVAVIILALYYYFTSILNFWKVRGVRGPRPIPGFGNSKDILLRRIKLGDYMIKLNSEYKDEPLIGLFDMREPILIVKDPDLIKDVLIKDFTTFANRGYSIHEKVEPLTQNLFFLEAKRWRTLRTKLSPVFTSRKLQGMFLMISVCADHLVDYMGQLVNKNEPVECVEVMANYTLDCIGICAFGIEMKALSDKENEYRRIAKQIFKPPVKGLLRLRLKQFSPRLYAILGHILPDTKLNSFFINLVLNNIAYREKNNIVRNDFIDILRELKKHSDKMDFDFTDTLMVSQAFTFYAAGFETSSTAISNTLYELALNQEIQDKLRKEIDEEYAKHGSSLLYDNIKKMNYLEKVFKESLRKYPPLINFTRVAQSNYTFKDTEISIPKGQTIWIPIFALQHDPHIYPEPDVFDPERFNEEAVRSRHPMFYLPFGDGPRNCIGARFAIYQSKIGLIKMLRNYKFESCEKTKIPYERNDNTFIVKPKNGIYLKITKINRT